MSIKKQYIPAPLASAVKNGYVTDASEILDENKGKRQDVINQETDSQISGIKGGSSKSIAELSEDIANEAERASDAEAGLRESIDELGQIGLDPDNAISTDGDDFDGDTTAKRSKIPTIGAIIDGNPGVYDVSKRNPTGGENSDGKFTLEYILANANTLIPTSRRYGGMEICFVHSIDNKYVQYRLMSQTFNNDEADWQGVDEKPINGSPNLIESGGTHKAISNSALNKKGFGSATINTVSSGINVWYINGLTLFSGHKYLIKISAVSAITGEMTIKVADSNQTTLKAYSLCYNSTWNGSEYVLNYTPSETLENCSVGSWINNISTDGVKVEVSIEEDENKVVRVDQVQSFTNSEKQQVQNNIGVLYKDCIAYFTNGKYPSFSININHTLTVTLPENEVLRIISQNGVILKAINIAELETQTFDIISSRALIYDIDNDTIHVQTMFNVDVNRVVLLSLSGGSTSSINSVDGILKDFYRSWYDRTNIANLSTEVSTLKGISLNNYFIGKGDTMVTMSINGLVCGQEYNIYPDKQKFLFDELTVSSSSYGFVIVSMSTDNTQSELFVVTVGNLSNLKDHYSFTVPNNSKYIILYARANDGVKVPFNIAISDGVNVTTFNTHVENNDLQFSKNTEWKNKIQFEDNTYYDSYVKGSSTLSTSFWADRTLNLKAGIKYKFTFIPRANIRNSQESSSYTDGYCTIKIADSNDITLKVSNAITSWDAGVSKSLEYTPTNDVTGAKIGSWNDKTNEVTFDVYGEVVKTDVVNVQELYSKELGKTLPFKRYNDFTALFFSDIHGASENIGRIFDIARAFSPDAVINGGDTYQYGPITGSGSTESIAWYNNAVDAYNGDVLNTIGNHDAWDWNTGGNGVVLIPQVDAYNAITAKVVSKVSGLVQPTNAATNGLNYYYKDYGNIRLIVLDSTYGGNVNLSSYPPNYGMGPAIQSYVDAQNTWLSGVLVDAKTNNKVVICMTHALNPSTIQKSVNKFSRFNDWRTVGRSYIIDGTSKATTDGVSLAKSTFDIVQGFIDGTLDGMSAGGTFACWLVGHQHFDQSYYFTDYEKQPIFIISSARASYHDNEGGSTTDKKSKMYDCFNAFGISTERSVIKLMRFGYNLDATLGKRDMMCYDYIHHTLINDY